MKPCAEDTAAFTELCTGINAVETYGKLAFPLMSLLSTHGLLPLLLLLYLPTSPPPPSPTPPPSLAAVQRRSSGQTSLFAEVSLGPISEAASWLCHITSITLGQFSSPERGGGRERERGCWEACPYLVHTVFSQRSKDLI